MSISRITTGEKSMFTKSSQPSSYLCEGMSYQQCTVSDTGATLSAFLQPSL